MDEEIEKESETEEQAAPAKDTDEGGESEATEIIKQQDERIKELEKEKQQRVIDDAKKALGGKSEAGSVPEKPKKMTDTEYAEALERGEVNPLKEDGII